VEDADLLAVLAVLVVGYFAGLVLSWPLAVLVCAGIQRFEADGGVDRFEFPQSRVDVYGECRCEGVLDELAVDVGVFLGPGFAGRQCAGGQLGLERRRAGGVAPTLPTRIS